jgi:hypothetical protein
MGDDRPQGGGSDDLVPTHHHHIASNHPSIHGADTIIEHHNIECSSPEYQHLLFGAACVIDHNAIATLNTRVREMPGTAHDYDRRDPGTATYHCSAGHVHTGVPPCPVSGVRVSPTTGTYTDLNPADVTDQPGRVE